MDILLISIALSSLSLAALGLYKMSSAAQIQYEMDASRKSYSLVFPTSTTEKQIQSFLRSIGTSLVPNEGDRGATPTLVFEVRWTPRGLRHILRVTGQDDAHVKLMLDTYLPGITYDLVDTQEERLDIAPVFGLSVEMTDCSRLLTTSTVGGQSLVDDISNGILGSVPTVKAGEIVTYQVIVSHTSKFAQPKTQAARSLFYGKQELSPELLKEVTRKRAEHNFNVSIRIGVQAAVEIRAKELAGGLIRTVRQTNNKNVQLNGQTIKGNLASPFTYALTPRSRTAQLTVTELSALMAAPIGDPQVPGLTQGAARRLHATEAISSDGEWTLGYSDVHGREKKITLPSEFISQHVSVIGSPGTGKTVFLANAVCQYAAADLGIVVIDAGQDVSTQRLYYRALDGMPRKRSDDVICINPADDADFPVSLNLLDQDFGKGAIDIVVGVFESLYPDTMSKGVSVRELLYNGLWTLIDAGGHTLMDLPSLLSPRNEAEWRWAVDLINNVKDPELKDFWNRNPGAVKRLGDSSKARSDWDRYVEPIHRRLWQLSARPEIRYLLGQTKSTVKIKDVLEQNKILLFSVGGMNDAAAAQLLASLFTQMVWTAAQSITPAKPNVMVLDEFQVSTRIQGGLPDMLARARALNLGLILATQYVTRENIPRELQSAVLNNTATRIVFRAGSREADEWSREFGKRIVSDTDITRLHKFHAVAQVANKVGDRSPVTFKALKPAADTQLTKHLVYQSRQRYGKHVDSVRQEITQRRRIARTPAVIATNKDVGESPYNPDNFE